MNKSEVKIVSSFRVAHVESIDVDPKTRIQTETLRKESPVMFFDRSVSELAENTIVSACLRGSRGVAQSSDAESNLSSTADVFYMMVGPVPTLPRPVDTKTGRHLSEVLVWAFLTGEENATKAAKAKKAAACRKSGIDVVSTEAACTMQRAILKSAVDGNTPETVKETAKVAFDAAINRGSSERIAAAEAVAAIDPVAGKKAEARNNRAPAGLSVEKIAEEIANPEAQPGIIAAMVERMTDDDYAKFRKACNLAFKNRAAG